MGIEAAGVKAYKNRQIQPVEQRVESGSAQKAVSILPDRPWWDGIDFRAAGNGSDRLAALLDADGSHTVGSLLAEGRRVAEKRYQRSVSSHTLEVRKVVFSIIYASFHAERVMRRLCGDRGDTHTHASEMLRASGHTRMSRLSVELMRTTHARDVTVPEIIAMLKSGCFSPPVSSWLVEMLASEVGLFVAASPREHDEESRSPCSEPMRCGELESRCVDVMAAGGTLALSIRSAVSDGHISDEERVILRSRVNDTIAWLSSMCGLLS